MDLTTMRSELRRLSELVAGWDDSQDIPPLERDLALEKLRRLYEALRFGTDVPAADDASPVAVPLSIELDDVLVSVSVPEEEAMHETGAAPEREVAAEPEAVPENGSESRPPVPETESCSEPVPDPLPEPEGVDAAEVFEELTVRTVPACEEAPAPAPESTPVPEPEPEPAPVPEASSRTESFRAKPQPVPGPESAPAPESLKPGSAPEKSEPAPQSVAPTLFELEDETVRHRRKQRVIMSLYDTEPAASAPKPKSAPVPPSVPTPEPVSGPQPTPTPAEPEPREIADAKEGETMFAAGEPVAAPLTRASDAAQAGASAPESGTESRPAPVEPAPAEPAAGTVLGEVINHDKKTLSDTIARPRDVASELRRSEPVTDLRRAVGINDKFLLIRDLFGGDGAAYEITIRRLNEFDNFDDCMIYIAENFAWNPNSDGAKLLMDLLERKFS